ncbi:response regulator transcription factor [Bradyrhizobium sp. WSM 1704]|uniref:LuxR C-terminal-related transcriptional regulator n=1 Tax=Bradyrhizobium semiaridum TaxID=2821404 RepID=UPI001CE30BE7|nr:response regulator transcription factor [Bradyrhizobium semiaridum]MCA6122015.1 response regulator transcription factor [Bradyrhizobium semiaridum]
MQRRQSFAAVVIGKSVLLREALSGILRAAHFRIQSSVSSTDELIPSTAQLQRHQLLFLIVHTGDDFESVAGQIALLQARYPNGLVAIVADRYRESDLVSAFRSGASGYLVDITTCDAFIKSIELVMMGQTVFPPALRTFVRSAEFASLGETAPHSASGHSAADDSTAPQLSPREKLILRCLVEGDTNKCVARKLDIAEATVKVHVKAILRKIRVQNRTQAAIWALNNNELLTHPIDKGSAAANAGKQASAPDAGIAERPAQLRVIAQNANHVGIDRINGELIHDVLIQKATGAGRIGK